MGLRCLPEAEGFRQTEGLIGKLWRDDFIELFSGHIGLSCWLRFDETSAKFKDHNHDMLH
jgi:hypothetical protein